MAFSNVGFKSDVIQNSSLNYLYTWLTGLHHGVVAFEVWWNKAHGCLLSTLKLPFWQQQKTILIGVLISLLPVLFLYHKELFMPYLSISCWHFNLTITRTSWEYFVISASFAWLMLLYSLICRHFVQRVNAFSMLWGHICCRHRAAKIFP